MRGNDRVERLRVRFSKEGDLRFLSHHNLMKVFERALRRSGLPIRISGGFNPRLKMSFPLALGVGVKAEDELMEFELTGWTKPSEVQKRLLEQFPEGIRINSVEAISPRESAQVSEVLYEVGPLPRSRLNPGRLISLLAKRKIIASRIRKGRPKQVNIRPFIKDLRVAGSKLRMHMAVTPVGTARPAEVLEALGFEDALGLEASRATRVKVSLAPQKRPRL